MRALLAFCGRALLILGSIGGATEGTPRQASDEIVSSLYEALDGVRESAGLASLERSDPLQRLAGSRAGRIALERTRARMRHPVPLGDALDDWPELAGRRIIERVVMVRPSLDGTERIRAAWDNPETGALALDPDASAVGLGAWTAIDGTFVFLALFETGHVRSGREAIEQAITKRINEVRTERGLTALTLNTELREVARAHSDVMLAGDFMSHESPDGSMPADRVRAAKIDFKLVGENVARSLGSLGAVQGVVDEWMASPLHRHNILTPEFSETGVGAAIGADGRVYLTQLFRDP